MICQGACDFGVVSAVVFRILFLLIAGAGQLASEESQLDDNDDHSVDDVDKSGRLSVVDL